VHCSDVIWFHGAESMAIYGGHILSQLAVFTLKLKLIKIVNCGIPTYDDDD